MKSPAELAVKLSRQWQSADLREARLLGEYEWPIRLPIGRPKAQDIQHSSAKVREHLQRWRNEKTGQIEWDDVSYQATATAVTMPCFWVIQTADEWMLACNDRQINWQFEFLSQLIKQVDPQFHSLLIRQRSLWKNMVLDELIQCCELSLQLEPGCAQGQPLRSLTLTNVDSKFIENNRSLLLKLLNVRFNQSLKNTSLEEFIGAPANNDHWLLVMGLSKGLLPFEQLRIRASELAEIVLPCSHLLVVENEQCRYQLPELDNTIAILGAGLDLSWLGNSFFKSIKLAYWGDIDSWGMKMLSMARRLQPELIPLLMDQSTFEKHSHLAVVEPQTAGADIPDFLTEDEQQLYNKLLQSQQGRLEQEFIDRGDVQQVLRDWHL